MDDDAPQTVTQPLVLEYAQAKASPVRRLVRGALALGLVVIGAVVGGLIGRAVAPVTWTASGLYQSSPSVISLIEPDEGIVEWERDLKAHIGALGTSQALEAVADDVASRGRRVPSSGRTEWLRRGLRIEYVPDSTLVTISFRSNDPLLATDVVDAMLSVARSRRVDGVTPRVFLRPAGALPARNPAVPGAGAVLGASAALLGVWLATRKSGERK